jgi:hypothetical protein
MKLWHCDTLIPWLVLGVQIRRRRQARNSDFDHAVIESLVPRIACIGQIIERPLRDGGDHFRKEDVVYSWMSDPNSIECAAEIPKLVACEFPVVILLGLPESLVPRLNRRDH